MLYDAGNPSECSVTAWGGGDGEGGGREGTYVYLWLIHVDVWQKPLRYYKIIILQLKIKFFEKVLP